MTDDNTKIRMDLEIDQFNQWFVTLFVRLGSAFLPVRFKVDTGCNALVLSHKTLKRLGRSTDKTTLATLSDVPGTLASGETHTFKQLGGIFLFQDIKRTTPVCNTNAICHATRQTNDLLGTEVFRQFSGVSFNLVGDRFMELKR
jgi:hypothetical protein